MFLAKPIDLLITGLKWIGCLILAMMMFLTALDVAFRYLFNRPIAGALELVEYMMAVLIPFSVAYCAHCRSHVAVEFIMEKLPSRVRQAVQIPVTLVTLVFLAVITWQTCLYVVETFESRVTSSVLLIAAYPFVVPIALGMGAFTLILVHDVLTGGRRSGG